ncbi:MAG: hypothetical protein QME66_05770 [Candidatus Eisenbacteria bacterium]|nr:hypothetical protein [Candidatus Eisenbacteria bacterium]
MIKKLAVLAAFLIGCGLPFLAVAQINTPTTGDGVNLSPLEAPCRHFVLGQATGTTTVVLASGVSYVDWVLTSTSTADGASYVVFEDTSVLTNTTLDLMRVYSQSTSQNTLVEFKPPVIFLNGIFANKAVAADWAVVCYRTYSTQVP